ncbi:MAG: VCBS repeat-containing protein [Chitinophagaceae bacterium]|nr:VCBS repeat-containing protein [Chitinophagaceae bacterium]
MGTGNPSYQSVIPNRLYKNIGGNNFVDVTHAAKLGHLQKGHGVAFADIDNNGTQDIAIELGGAYIGDAYNNALFYNPGQPKNNWIGLNWKAHNPTGKALVQRSLLPSPKTANRG